MAWYDLKQENLSKRDYISLEKYKEKITLCSHDLMDVIDFELLKTNQYRIVTEKSFNALVVIDAITKKFDIEEVTIAVYRMNISAVNYIKELNGMRVNLLLSSFFRENKKYERWTRELELYSTTNENVNLGFAWSHAKVFICKTLCGRYIVMEGSGNLSDNARIEQYTIEDDINVFNFHNKWIKNEIKEYRQGS